MNLWRTTNIGLQPEKFYNAHATLNVQKSTHRLHQVQQHSNITQSIT